MKESQAVIPVGSIQQRILEIANCDIKFKLGQS